MRRGIVYRINAQVKFIADTIEPRTPYSITRQEVQLDVESMMERGADIGGAVYDALVTHYWPELWG